MSGFSVIIPTCDRPEALGRCLTAIAALDYPAGGFEVIVVNDGGAPIDLANLPRQPGCNLRLITQRNAGPAQARNTGAAVAAGEFFIFLDDDCEPAPDWLKQWEMNVRRWPGHALGGWARNALPSNLFSSASQILIDYLYSYYNRGTGARPFVTSNNLCVPAAAYRNRGGFSPAFRRSAAEDRDFCDAWSASGLPIRVVEAAIVYHAHNLSPRTFWRQHFGYGKGAVLYHARSAARRGEPVRIEPAGFYAGLILWPFRRESLRKACALSSLLVVAQIANFAGFLSEAIARFGGRPL
jgi:GT2 family glycosyltransferase